MKLSREAYVWILALAGIAFMPPDTFSICLFKRAGIPCPGCGLGHSIYYLLRGDFALSFSSHPLGIPAVIILLHRICSLISFNPRIYKTIL